MTGSEPLTPEEVKQAENIWCDASIHMVLSAVELNGGISNIKDPEVKSLIENAYKLTGRDANRALPVAVHKQFVNRLMEFAMHHVVLITATDWRNFFALRISREAQPDLRVFAEAALEAIENSTPRELQAGQWHMPYVDINEEYYGGYDEEALKKVATAKAARLSYLNQEQHIKAFEEGRKAGKTKKQIMDELVQKDVGLHDMLVANGHMSPLEHVATPFGSEDWKLIKTLKSHIPENHYLLTAIEYNGNFRGWHQYRKQLLNESDYSYQLQPDALLSQEDLENALAA